MRFAGKWSGHKVVMRRELVFPAGICDTSPVNSERKAPIMPKYTVTASSSCTIDLDDYREDMEADDVDMTDEAAILDWLQDRLESDPDPLMDAGFDHVEVKPEAK